MSSLNKQKLTSLLDHWRRSSGRGGDGNDWRVEDKAVRVEHLLLWLLLSHLVGQWLVGHVHHYKAIY